MIKIIRLTSNEVVIAEVVNEGDRVVELNEPFALVPDKDGNVTFVPWSPLSENDTTVNLYARNIMYIATPNQDVIDNYKEIFSTIITPKNAGKIIT